jgi:phosphatidylglycerophosphate synthase
MMRLFDTDRLAKLRQKQENSFTPIFLHRPLAILFLYFFADVEAITPNRLTTVSIILRALVAYLILPRQWGGPEPSVGLLLIAISLWHFGCVLDAADGALARYRGKGTPFGRYYDKISDRVLSLLLMLALAGRAYFAVGRPHLLALTAIYLSLIGTTSTAKWIDLGIRASEGVAEQGTADPLERPSPTRTLKDWVVYVFYSLRTLPVVTEMDLPLWATVAMLFRHEDWLIYYLACFSIPYALVTLFIRGTKLYRLPKAT